MRRISFFIILMSMFTTILASCSRYDGHVPEALAEIADSKDITSLSEITSYEWDKVYVVGPYESFDCSVIKGVPAKVKHRLKRQELLESWFVLLFTLNQKFVSYSEVCTKTVDELGLERASTYKPTTCIPIITTP